MIYDLLIAGAGPAGLSAAVYAKRAMLKAAVIDATPLAGGQIINTNEIENYLGFSAIGGQELAEKFKIHAEKLGTEFITGRIKAAFRDGGVITVQLRKQELQARALIIATGAGHRLLGTESEAEFTGRGISYCATCDGAFYAGKTVAVIGGGDAAVGDALYLSRICKKVYIIHRRDVFRANRLAVDRMLKCDNVEAVYSTVASGFSGKDKIEKISVENLVSKEKSELTVDGVFIAVGIAPNSQPFLELVDCDSSGFIIADESCRTSVEGVFAAGDIRTKPLRQVVCAVSDGAVAVDQAVSYLNSLGADS